MIWGDSLFLFLLEPGTEKLRLTNKLLAPTLETLQFAVKIKQIRFGIMGPEFPTC